MIRNLQLSLVLIFIIILGACSKKTGNPTSANPGMDSTISSVVYTEPSEDSLIKQIESNTDAIVWLEIERAEELNSVKPKKFFIDMYTDWCYWCKQMDSKTFSDPEVISYVNKNYYAIKFDAETSDSIKFNDKTYTFQGKANQFAIDMLEGYLQYPTTVYLDADKSLISHVPGFWKTKDFLLILKFFNEDHYKNMKFEEYKNKQ